MTLVGYDPDIIRDTVSQPLNSATCEGPRSRWMTNVIDTNELKQIAPAGYHIALRMIFAFPMEEHNGMPEAWVSHYTSRGFMMKDPVLRWAYGAIGVTRWSALSRDDPFGIFDQARVFGLRYGIAISCYDAASDTNGKGARSFGSFARTDREFEAAEIARLHDIVAARHLALTPPTNLTAAELEALRLAREGHLLKELAHA